MKKQVAFLRGINVGGHHKVPMVELRRELEKMNFHDVSTILNSGNVLFESDAINLEDNIARRLETVFGFPVPTRVRSFETILNVWNDNPFEDITVTKDIRLYVSFLKEKPNPGIPLPWTSEDGSYKILAERDGMVFSVLDIAITKTPKAMEALEKFYGKDMTTRNWKTIQRIIKKSGI